MRHYLHRSVALVAAVGLSLATAACAGDDGPSELSTTAQSAATRAAVSISSPRDGAHIAGNTVFLQVAASGVQIVKADGDTSGKTGHFHVFVDTDPVRAGEAIGKTPQIVHSADNPISITGLPVGDHTLKVVVGDGAHTRIAGNVATVHVHVDGPELDATAPATLRAGEALSVAVAVTGFTLVKADGDTSGATGHLHAFVDVAPVAPGEAIPTGNPAIIHSATAPIVIQGLAPGEHTIWILAGDGNHVAFKNPVRDKVVVTVA